MKVSITAADVTITVEHEDESVDAVWRGERGIVVGAVEAFKDACNGIWPNVMRENEVVFRLVPTAEVAPFNPYINRPPITEVNPSSYNSAYGYTTMQPQVSPSMPSPSAQAVEDFYTRVENRLTGVQNDNT